MIDTPPFALSVNRHLCRGPAGVHLLHNRQRRDIHALARGRVPHRRFSSSQIVLGAFSSVRSSGLEPSRFAPLAPQHDGKRLMMKANQQGH